MADTKSPMKLRVVLIIAVVILFLSSAGALNHALALKAAASAGIEIDGWLVFIRSVLMLIAQAISAGAASFFILRGSVLAAHNASGMFLSIMLASVALNGVKLVGAPSWQMFLSAVWFFFLAWLLWRVVPNTSLNPDAAKRSAG